MDKETIEVAAEKFADKEIKECDSYHDLHYGFYEGAKWQQEKMYSAEVMRKAYDQGIDDSFDIGFSNKDDANFNKWFEQFKKE